MSKGKDAFRTPAEVTATVTPAGESTRKPEAAALYTTSKVKKSS